MNFPDVSTDEVHTLHAHQTFAELMKDIRQTLKLQEDARVVLTWGTFQLLPHQSIDEFLSIVDEVDEPDRKMTIHVYI